MQTFVVVLTNKIWHSYYVPIMATVKMEPSNSIIILLLDLDDDDDDVYQVVNLFTHHIFLI